MTTEYVTGWLQPQEIGQSARLPSQRGRCCNGFVTFPRVDVTRLLATGDYCNHDEVTRWAQMIQQMLIEPGQSSGIQEGKSCDGKR
jgi:hypothetical protein